MNRSGNEALTSGTGSGGFLIFGVVFSWAASEDFIAPYRLARLDKDPWVADRPEEIDVNKMEVNISKKGEAGRREGLSSFSAF